MHVPDERLCHASRELRAPPGPRGPPEPARGAALGRRPRDTDGARAVAAGPSRRPLYGGQRARGAGVRPWGKDPTGGVTMLGEQNGAARSVVVVGVVRGA